MLDYLTILRMHYSQNLSFRKIGASVGCGKTAVGRFITRFEESEFTYPLPQNYSNEQIEAALYKKRGGTKNEFAEPDVSVKSKTYFIKMSELNDMFTQARAYGRSGRVISNLVKPSCLIIDEVGHCVFDKENTRMFFDLVDRRYNKEDPYTMIFTSNKQPSQWKQNFNEDDSLLCALDRIFDDAMIFNLRGNSYRGKECESYSLTTLRGKATNTVLPATN